MRIDLNGSSLDVIRDGTPLPEQASTTSRELRERVLLQPVEGRSKVYILTKAHQLNKEAWGTRCSR